MELQTANFRRPLGSHARRTCAFAPRTRIACSGSPFPGTATRLCSATQDQDHQNLCVAPLPLFPKNPVGPTHHRVRTMSCCGSARPPQKSGHDPVGTLQPFPISQQPTAHPGISPFEKPLPLQHQSVAPPPQAYSLSRLNGNPSSPPPRPPSSTVHAASIAPGPSPPPSAAFNRSSVVDHMSPLSPLRLPSPTYPASGNQSLLSTYQPVAVPPSLPPTDEGKVSIAIDFGERRAPDLIPRCV